MDEGSLWSVTSITRAHYETLKAAGQPIPNVRWLIEASGEQKQLWLSNADTAVPTNPRADRLTCQVIDLVT